jgi:hypothetical protein
MLGQHHGKSRIMSDATKDDSGDVNMGPRYHKMRSEVIRGGFSMVQT